jgi:transcription antitermination factor NusG
MEDKKLIWFAAECAILSQERIISNFNNIYSKELNIKVEEFYYPYSIVDKKKHLFLSNYLFINAVWDKNFLVWESAERFLKTFAKYYYKDSITKERNWGLEIIPEEQMLGFKEQVNLIKAGDVPLTEFEIDSDVTFIRGPLIGCVGKVVKIKKNKVVVELQGFKRDKIRIETEVENIN